MSSPFPSDEGARRRQRLSVVAEDLSRIKQHIDHIDADLAAIRHVHRHLIAWTVHQAWDAADLKAHRLAARMGKRSETPRGNTPGALQP